MKHLNKINDKKHKSKDHDAICNRFQILGKVFVIHEGQDDLGTGGDEGSEVR